MSFGFVFALDACYRPGKQACRSGRRGSYVCMTVEGDRTVAKQRMRELIEKARVEQRVKGLAPATSTQTRDDLNEEILQAIADLEQLAPSNRPLLDSPMLLDGVWLTTYSNAREITSLSKLPLGFNCEDIYQVIDVANRRFANLAVVGHASKILRGFVRVSAIFSIAAGNLSMRRPVLFDKPARLITVQFIDRSFHLTKIGPIPSPSFLNPFSEVDAGGGRGRVPSLEITYLDPETRVGRSPTGLYVLEKQDKIPDKAHIPAKYVPGS